MAYLILEENGPESESTCFEFNPDNGASLEKIEALLARRTGETVSNIERMGEITEESLLPNRNQATARGVMGRIVLRLNALLHNNTAGSSDKTRHWHRLPSISHRRREPANRLSFVS